ncbi:MAG: MarR family transcriptional regulator, partial [Actinomycetales bacterium]
MRSDSTALAARPLHDDDRLTAMGLLEETRAGVSELLAPQLAEHGLSVLEFVVLLRLGRSPGERLRMADLATQVLLSASGLTRVIDRIENQGL